MARGRGKVYDPRYLVFGHVVLFVLFLSILPNETLVGLERIAATYLMVLLLSYGITLNWNQSATVALVFVLLLGLLDQNGVYSDWRNIFNNHESFENKDERADMKKAQTRKEQVTDKLKGMVSEDIMPAGEGEDPGKIPPASTLEKDDTGLMLEDLDAMLAADDANEARGDSAQQKLYQEAGGGLEGLSKLLKEARDESIDGKAKSADDHTPAEAQRKTHQMINTMKMLKETMSEMLPVMKQSTQVMDLYQKLGGKDMMKAFQ